MMNQEVMVVLTDGKPVTVVRPRHPDIPSSSASVNSPTSSAKSVSIAESKSAIINRELRGKEFEEHIELKRLRTENRLLQQRVENLEQVLSKRGDERIRDSSQPGCSCNCKSHGHDTSSSAADTCHVQPKLLPASPVVEQQQQQLPAVDIARVSEVESSDNELQRIQDELVACKLREAEANLSMKEFQQKVNQLERHWQQFLQENRGSHSVAGSKSSSQADLKDTVMALRLRETYLVCDLNLLKQKLMELETQNHIYERQIKRLESEQATLQETISAAELRERELMNTIVQYERKFSDFETKGKEDAVMSRIRDAEHSQVLAEMRRRIAELEIENQELLTSAKLNTRDSDVGDLESRITSELQYEAAHVSNVRSVDAITERNVFADDVIESDDVESISIDMTGSLLLSDNFEMDASASVPPAV